MTGAQPFNEVLANRGTSGQDVGRCCLGKLAFKEPVEKLACELQILGVGLITELGNGTRVAGRGLGRCRGGAGRRGLGWGGSVLMLG